jgi:DNA invertase Pin-like site-specific DNA recombinase
MGTLEQSIYFGMAQQEREYISQRTKAALAALKKQGVKLGAPGASFSSEMREKALCKRRQNTLSNEANKRAYAVVSVMSGNYSEKARYLNNNGFYTAKGGKWRSHQVKRLIDFFHA